MIQELTYIAGIAIDGITTYANYRAIRDSINNDKEVPWVEKDMPVDNEWLDLARNKGILNKSSEYSWPVENISANVRIARYTFSGSYIQQRKENYVQNYVKQSTR